MTKVDFKKQKELYQPSARAVSRIDVPNMVFLMVDGQGDPNGLDFEERVQALYSLSYGLKMLPKKGITPEGYYDYGVAPLEGLWSAEGEFSLEDRDTWQYTLMIRQPEFVTPQLVETVREAALKKNVNPCLAKVRLEEFQEGLSVQIMHIGPYAQEPATLAKIKAYCTEKGYHLRGRHHEIYLGDPRKTDSSKLKTVLRQPIIAK